MRVLVLGGTGAIGRPLVRELVGRGHAVTASTRDGGSSGCLSELGAEAVVLDALDLRAVSEAVTALRPEVLVAQVTSLSGDLARIGELVAENSRVRSVATANALAAAEAAGVRRFVAQGIAFGYVDGAEPADEAEPFTDDPTATPARQTEEAVLGSSFEGVSARYGYFYGPGTWYSRDGAAVQALRAGAFPAVGSGEESLVHVEDAAVATALLCEEGEPGAYNVVDDEPASRAEWLPVLADAVGAPAPERVDGPRSRGASNAKLRALGWEPRFTSWRQGFREGLG